MTCIVGFTAPDGRVWIGADRTATSDSGMQTIREEKKVFLLTSIYEDGPTMLLGGTTSFRFLDLLQYKLELPSYNPAIEPRKYLVTAFVDALREGLKGSGYDKKSDGEEQGGEFLLGWQGKLYHVFDDYQIGVPAIGYDAVGSGVGVALGVMFATQKRKVSPEKRLTLALQAAAYHCRSVRAPFDIESIPRVDTPYDYSEDRRDPSSVQDTLIEA